MYHTCGCMVAGHDTTTTEPPLHHHPGIGHLLASLASVASRERGGAWRRGAKRHTAMPGVALRTAHGSQSVAAGPNGEVVVPGNESHLKKKQQKRKKKVKK